MQRSDVRAKRVIHRSVEVYSIKGLDPSLVIYVAERETNVFIVDGTGSSEYRRACVPY